MFDDFEQSLGRLLEFIGVTSDRVVRWKNHEKIHYPGRIGDITQYRAGASLEDITSNDRNHPWIGTVDIRKGGPWQVYSATRHNMASKSPVAVMAQIGEMGIFEMERDATEHRLVAFRMGTLNKPAMTHSEFLQEYPMICSSYFEYQYSGSDHQKLSRSQALCKAFGASSNDVPSLAVYNEELFWKGIANSTCRQRTHPFPKILFKDAKDIPTAVSKMTS